MRLLPQTRMGLAAAACLLATAWPASAEEPANVPPQPQAEAPVTKQPEAPQAEAAPPTSDAAGLVNKANNPLTAASAFNLQNFYSPALYGAPTSQSNSLLVRVVIPFKVGVQQILRATLPLSTPSNVDGVDPKSGLGDLNIFDLLLVTAQDAKVQFGLGPMATFPTANRDLGTGKWQLGAAAVVTWEPTKELLFGALVTFQEGIGGDDARRATNQLVVQPIVNLHVGQGFYLRSTATESYDFLSGQYVVPVGVGVGVGKVVKAGRFAFNLYLEPQFTVLHRGQGQPTLQVLGGLNLQYFHDQPDQPSESTAH